jgi:hypothetical protein
MVPESGVSGPLGTYYNVNGINMTQEEYEVYKKEYWRKYGEELGKDKGKPIRDLSIPCVVEPGLAWLTDEEISELMEKYDEIAFREYHGYEFEFIPAGGIHTEYESNNSCYK